MLRAKASYKTNNQTFPKPGTQDYDRIKSQAVSFLVQKAEFAQEAEKMGITVTDKQIQDRLAQIKKQYFNGNDKAYQKQLKTQGLTEKEVESDIKDQLISQDLYDKVTAGVKASDADIKKYYNAHLTQYQQPESRTVRHILISVCSPSSPQGSKCLPDAKAKAKANQLYDQIKARRELRGPRQEVLRRIPARPARAGSSRSARARRSRRSSRPRSCSATERSPGRSRRSTATT